MMAKLPIRWRVRAPSGTVYEGWTDEAIMRAVLAGVPLVKIGVSAPAWHCPACCNIFDEKPKRGRCSECNVTCVQEG